MREVMLGASLCIYDMYGVDISFYPDKIIYSPVYKNIFSCICSFSMLYPEFSVEGKAP